mmetsp:Transcript_1849/g.4490  ORF Transcript_1849/g.4490 Transcript_1849/m.4490 type:complete len:223 (-) Transcript_1849:418-1086(-)
MLASLRLLLSAHARVEEPCRTAPGAWRPEAATSGPDRGEGLLGHERRGRGRCGRDEAAGRLEVRAGARRAQEVGGAHRGGGLQHRDGRRRGHDREVLPLVLQGRLRLRADRFERLERRLHDLHRGLRADLPLPLHEGGPLPGRLYLAGLRHSRALRALEGAVVAARDLPLHPPGELHERRRADQLGHRLGLRGPAPARAVVGNPEHLSLLLERLRSAWGAHR